MIYSLVQLVVKSINKGEGTRAADLLLWSPALVVLCREEREEKSALQTTKKLSTAISRKEKMYKQEYQARESLGPPDRQRHQRGKFETSGQHAASQQAEDHVEPKKHREQKFGSPPNRKLWLDSCRKVVMRGARARALIAIPV